MLIRSTRLAALAWAVCGAILAAAPAAAQDGKQDKPQDKPKEAKAKERADADRAGRQEQDRAVLKDFRTFVQQEWAGDPQAEPAAKRLHENFDAVFPDGVYIGSSRPDDEKERYGLWFRSPERVRKFLPQRGPPRTLTRTEKDESPKLGGLAGQLLAAKLNVAFNDRDRQDKGGGDLSFGELELESNPQVNNLLVGVPVKDLIRFADRVISGDFGQFREKRDEGEVEYDVTGDRVPDLSLLDLREALYAVNTAFENGQDKGILGPPDPEAAKAAEKDKSDLKPRRRVQLGDIKRIPLEPKSGKDDG